MFLDVPSLSWAEGRDNRFTVIVCKSSQNNETGFGFVVENCKSLVWRDHSCAPMDGLIFDINRIAFAAKRMEQGENEEELLFALDSIHC
ncbi:MAG TPA: hypothetical protein VGN53_14385 [Klebsiella sp.]|jgi:hypothetical protein